MVTSSEHTGLLSLSVSGAPDRTYCIQITEHMNPLDHHLATAM